LLTSSEIAKIIGGTLSGPGDTIIQDLLLDSRKSSLMSENALFIAIEGEVNDGHDYISTLYRAGVRAFLVEKEIPGINIEKLEGAAIIKSDSSVDALHRIALYVREKYKGRVISITGSNGKTIVKEWLSDIIELFDTTVRSPRSYNSQTGVPLSLWRLNEKSRYAVIEAGMSLPGEIARLEKIIKPDVGVITNIGEAHQENFSNLEEKVYEKISLFKHSDYVVYCKDHILISGIIESEPGFTTDRLFSWSSLEENKEANIRIVPISRESSSITVEIFTGKKKVECYLPFTDRASFENICTVISVAVSLGFEIEKIVDGIAHLEPVAMRMEKKVGINDTVLICDYYNSDPGSLDIALDHLKMLPFGKKTLVISDFIQTGRDIESLGREILLYSRRAGVTRYICVGKKLGQIRDMFPDDTNFFEETSDLVEWYRPSYFSNEAILLKGARIFEFETISLLLELQIHTTRLEINLSSVARNLNYYRSKLKKSTRVMAMVKAFAYGAGPRDIAEWLNYNGIEFLTVAYTNEGIDLRKAGVTNRIMVMSPEPTSFRLMVEHDLEPELFSLDLIRQFMTEADKNGLVDYPVHIKLDTGMYRLGLAEDELEDAVNLLMQKGTVKIASVFSHLGSADEEAHDKITHLQAERFERMARFIEDITGSTFLKHLLNSAGIERFPQYQYDLVRIGIGLYYPGGLGHEKVEPAVYFKTKVSQVKSVKAGDGVGYGFSDILDKERIIAILPVGYADGLYRKMGEGRSRMYINGFYVPVVGRICMDMCMIDITGKRVVPGDEVEIFGEHISIGEVAEICETIPHEILTGIPPRVRRVFYYN
jgi:alanine racemase